MLMSNPKLAARQVYTNEIEQITFFTGVMAIGMVIATLMGYRETQSVNAAARTEEAERLKRTEQFELLVDAVARSEQPTPELELSLWLADEHVLNPEPISEATYLSNVAQESQRELRKLIDTLEQAVKLCRPEAKEALNAELEEARSASAELEEALNTPEVIVPQSARYVSALGRERARALKRAKAPAGSDIQL